MSIRDASKRTLSQSNHFVKEDFRSWGGNRKKIGAEVAVKVVARVEVNR